MWERLGLAVLSLLAGPIQHCRAAVLDGWRDCVSANLCGRRVLVWTSPRLVCFYATLYLSSCSFEMETRAC